MRLKKYKFIKFILLKIFVLQQKNKLNFNIKLKTQELATLIFLWKNGYILGFTSLNSHFYSIFLKKQFKQFSIQFFEFSVKSYSSKLSRQSTIISTSLLFSHKGLEVSNIFSKNIGGFLLCSIF